MPIVADGSLGTSNGAAPAEIPEWMPPLINCKIGQPDAWRSACVESLRSDPNIFVRDKELVHVTRYTEEDSLASEWTDDRGRTQRAVVPGSPRIHTMEVDELAVRMGTWAHWTKPVKVKGGFEDVPFDPQVTHARAIRAKKHWPGIPHLKGVAETPFPRPDLSMVQGAARYDRATGYLYEPSITFPVVTDAGATIEAAAHSREILEDVFADFPFATDAGPSGAVALILTMIARPAILGPVPAWVVGATTQGTGKSLLADVCAAIAYGRNSGRMPFPDSTGRNGDAEIEKRLGMIARHGKQCVNFDNADKTEIGGDSLETIISCPDEYTFRILGLSDGLTLLWRTVLIFTANNPRWSFGMNRRILHLALESPYAQPEHREPSTYKHPERANNLVEWALENRATLVGHALTILRAYAVARMPSPLSLGTFSAWARIVPSAIVWCGGVDPMLCRPGADGEESDATMQRQTLAREWNALCKANSVPSITAHDMVATLYPAVTFGQPPPTATPQWDALRGAIEGFAPSYGGKPPEAAKLSLALRGIAGSPIRTDDAPAPLRMFHVEGRSGGRARWQVVDVNPNRVPRKAAKGQAAPKPTPPPAQVPDPVAPVPQDEDDALRAALEAEAYRLNCG